mmetsp:Transcript_26344/g.63515  ORF Transcript_26344/g.63515 Transcript_26344/m.63515 type:complete len:339 (-) Transcript_26344:81-1097(-)|eukprot:CAMPEP_0114507318 /NCGR_PEP_ID=MMETSP0109-20121206/11942_1 /TAXON_ID=29199 /ORGANISM="Chlorarachnion reptans, Strain CCCM449" /LENGTH=338 /DNA_ID=CAMNT_0001686055 /DNA_START=126 /DNA_END=1139 /DNA_ORIENTATION=+
MGGGPKQRGVTERKVEAVEREGEAVMGKILRKQSKGASPKNDDVSWLVSHVAIAFLACWCHFHARVQWEGKVAHLESLVDNIRTHTVGWHADGSHHLLRLDEEAATILYNSLPNGVSKILVREEEDEVEDGKSKPHPTLVAKWFFDKHWERTILEHYSATRGLSLQTELGETTDNKYLNRAAETLYADRAYQIRGSQEDYDRVMTVPLTRRLREFERVLYDFETRTHSVVWHDGQYHLLRLDRKTALEIYNSLPKWVSKAVFNKDSTVMTRRVYNATWERRISHHYYSNTNTTFHADKAYQLVGKQTDYDRVMSKPQELRQQEFEHIRDEYVNHIRSL